MVCPSISTWLVPLSVPFSSRIICGSVPMGGAKGFSVVVVHAPCLPDSWVWHVSPFHDVLHSRQCVSLGGIRDLVLQRADMACTVWDNDGLLVVVFCEVVVSRELISFGACLASPAKCWNDDSIPSSKSS